MFDKFKNKETSINNDNRPTPIDTFLTDKLLIEIRELTRHLEFAAVQSISPKTSLPNTYLFTELHKRFERYSKTGIADMDDYRLMRRIFSETKGHSNKVLSESLEGLNYKLDCCFQSSQFINDEQQGMAYVRHVSSELRKTGYAKLKFSLAADKVKLIKQKIVDHLDLFYQGEASKILKKKNDTKPQIKTQTEWILSQEFIYEIASDPVLYRIAQEYLGIAPILTTPLAMLNGVCGMASDNELSKVAQLYHHDLDRLKFIKLFIYLTDVDLNSGPHAMIKSSHVYRPDLLWFDGRHSDSLIIENDLKNRETIIEGKAGTIFMVDTSSLHKGLHPKKTPRLMLQLQYSNSLFGLPIEPTNRKFNLDLDNLTNEQSESRSLISKYAQLRGGRFMQNFI